MKKTIFISLIFFAMILLSLKMISDQKQKPESKLIEIPAIEKKEVASKSAEVVKASSTPKPTKKPFEIIYEGDITYQRFYTNKYVVDYPRAWKVRTLDDGVEFDSPDLNYSSADAGFPIHTSGSRIQIIERKVNFKTAQEIFDNDEMLKSVAFNIEKVKYNGFDGLLYSIQYNGNSTNTLSFVRSNVQYLISYYYSPDSFNRDSAKYQHTLETFGFED